MSEAGSASPYAELGVRIFINAAGNYTRLGGSRMPPPVVAAMARAAGHFVDLEELQQAVHLRLARITRNEAAYVTSGAAAALLLSTAACMAGTDPGRARQLPDPRGMKSEVVIYRAHRNLYDYAIRTLPVRLVEVGFANTIAPAYAWELEHALTDLTIAVHYAAAGWTAPGALPLSEVIRIAHAAGVPVIVDAAAQLPPRENLWRFTEMGTDLAIFSGGKDLRGPQSTGLIVGRPDLIAACALIGAPHHGIGRPFKVGKEELVGLLAAVEWYLEQDEPARAKWAEELVWLLVDELDNPRCQVTRDYPNEAGQPLARAVLRFIGIRAEDRCARAVALLRAGDPSIEVAPAEADGFYVNPMTVEPEEQQPLLERLRAMFREIHSEEGDSDGR